MIHQIGKIIRVCAEFFSFVIGNLIPVNKSLVLLHGTTVSSYNESTRYLYEYLLSNSHLSAVWMTDSKIVYDYLKKSGRPVVMHRSINGAWHYMRAGVVVGNGSSYATLLNFTGISTIKICLHHGSGPRSTNAADTGRIKSSFAILNNFSKFDYFNSTSRYTDIVISKLQFLIPDAKRISFGLPRCDHLFDKKSVAERGQKKQQLRLSYPVEESTRCVLYSPTWRPKERPLPFPMSLIEGFSIADFDKWLKENDILLLVSVHPLAEELEDFSRCTNVHYLEQNPIVDINQLLPEIDLLITDYSSIATDYMLMDRPVVYVMPDYEYYLYNFGLLEDMRQNLPGMEAVSLIDLQNLILKSIDDPGKMSAERERYLNKYYDVKKTNACKSVSKFIEGLVE